jgi:hypothetical protein
VIEIDKNIPAPDPSRRGGAKYPWRQMEVGDSFFVADVTTNNLGTAAQQVGKRMGATFTTRKVDGGARVWRIS